MFEALFDGKLHGKPMWITSHGGCKFVSAKVIATTSAGRLYVGVVAFDRESQAALLALDAGDGVAIAGSLTATAYADKKRAGEPAPSIKVVAQSVTTLYHARRKRRNLQAEEVSP
jgi:hypothetical protein